MTPHKHAALIKAWADGHEIQFRYHPGHDWNTVSQPSWCDSCEYRVKPQMKTMWVRAYLYKISPHSPDSLIASSAMSTRIKENIEEMTANGEKYTGFIQWATDWTEVEYEA